MKLKDAESSHLSTQAGLIQVVCRVHLVQLGVHSFQLEMLPVQFVVLVLLLRTGSPLLIGWSCCSVPIVNLDPMWHC